MKIDPDTLLFSEISDAEAIKLREMAEDLTEVEGSLYGHLPIGPTRPEWVNEWIKTAGLHPERQDLAWQRDAPLVLVTKVFHSLLIREGDLRTCRGRYIKGRAWPCRLHAGHEGPHSRISFRKGNK